MEVKKIIRLTKEEIFIYLIYSVGIAGHLTNSLVNYMKLLTPLTLLLTGGVVLFSSLKHSSKNYLFWILITYITTFALEVIGVKTGLVFGSYWYGETLGLKVLDVPVIIGFNWTMVILGAILLSEKFFSRKIFILISASLMATLFDFFMEPSAIKLGYWNWSGISVPLQNYFAWFIISFIFSNIYFRMNIKVTSDLPIKFFVTQFVFFITLFVFRR